MALLGGRKSLLIYTGRKDGLGNRMRALLSGKALAETEDRDLYYVWSADSYFAPRLDQLWHLDGARLVPRLVSRAISPLHRYRGTDFSTVSAADRAAHLWQVRTRGMELTTGPQVRPWGAELRRLTPIAPIAERVRDTFASGLAGRPYVGVQVRAHTSRHAKTAAFPVEWFAERMRAIREQAPDITFFLSCDTEEVQAGLIKEFGNCVALEDKGGFNTVEGVQSSIADLYLLASAQHLIGAAHSSFVEMAVHLCGGIIPFERPNQPLEGDLDLSLGLAANPLTPAQRS
ncbi:hypothetical protein [Actinomyces oricola]